MLWLLWMSDDEFWCWLQVSHVGACYSEGQMRRKRMRPRFPGIRDTSLYPGVHPLPPNCLTYHPKKFKWRGKFIMFFFTRCELGFSLPRIPAANSGWFSAKSWFWFCLLVSNFESTHCRIYWESQQKERICTLMLRCAVKRQGSFWHSSFLTLKCWFMGDVTPCYCCL